MTEHVVVRFLTDAGRWRRGTTGTVVHSNGTLALVEIADARGYAVDLVTLPYEALASAEDQAR